MASVMQAAWNRCPHGVRAAAAAAPRDRLLLRRRCWVLAAAGSEDDRDAVLASLRASRTADAA
jgi:hypothetical protein